MRTGYEKGYQVVTLSDCVAATSAEEHENAIKFDYPMFSQPMSAEEFAGSLTGEHAALRAATVTRTPMRQDVGVRFVIQQHRPARCTSTSGSRRPAC